MPQLDISTYTPQIFWLIIIFSIMFGVFIGVFLPKLSSIFQKRFDSAKHADQQIQNLSEATAQLQKPYDEKKEIALKDAQNYIDEALASIRENHENQLQSLEQDIQQELKLLQKSYKQQHADFDETYKDIINESVIQILNKLGVKNGR